MDVIPLRDSRMFYLYTASLNDLTRNNSEVKNPEGSDYEVYSPLGWTA